MALIINKTEEAEVVKVNGNDGKWVYLVVEADGDLLIDLGTEAVCVLGTALVPRRAAVLIDVVSARSAVVEPAIRVAAAQRAAAAQARARSGKQGTRGGSQQTTDRRESEAPAGAQRAGTTKGGCGLNIDTCKNHGSCKFSNRSITSPTTKAVSVSFVS